MTGKTAFHVSTYLTLAIASLCLGFADETFLPGVLSFLIPVEICLVLGLLAESRWSLSLWASNLIGLIIGAGSVFWMIFNLLSPSNALMEMVPLPAALLPATGPIIMVLLLAKVFRPKRFRDFWGLHIMGLMQVTLACVLASDPIFGLLLFAYLGCALWSLMLFYLYREFVVGVEQIPVPGSPVHKLKLPWSRFGIGVALRCLLVVAAFGATLFVFTPRKDGGQWQSIKLSSDQIETGFSRLIDLNHAGHLKVNNAVALEVYARDASGKPKLDLNANQRWRGVTLDLYHNGRWLGTQFSPWHMFRAPRKRISTNMASLPYLGPNQYFLTFRPDANLAGGLFLSDPVAYGKLLGPVPVLTRFDDYAWIPEFFERDNTILPAPGKQPTNFYYEQVTQPAEDIGPVRPVSITPSYEKRLCQQPVDRIRSFTWALVRRLVAERTLGMDALSAGHDQEHRTGNRLLLENRARVAHVLRDYLASSGEYTYTLALRRKDLHIDPIEDFLCNVKQGHCELYAGAMVLMMRSLGIPSRVVNGFRGAESQQDGDSRDGYYYVRQSHAHSWAEALVLDDDANGKKVLCWQTLDATPSEESPDSAQLSFSQWWRSLKSYGGNVWWNWIINYSSDKQQNATPEFASLSQGLAMASKSGPFYLGLGGFMVAAAVFVASFIAFRLYKLWHRVKFDLLSRHRFSDFRLYERLLALASRQYHLAPSISQTPQEFGKVIEHKLVIAAFPSRLADIPLMVVHYLYRIRFGNQKLTETENRNVEQQFGALEQALNHPPSH